MASVGSFTMEGTDIFNATVVAMKIISIGDTGRVCGFVSIAVKRDTSELVVHFSFSARCWILHR